MKRLLLSLVALGGISLFTTPAMAGGRHFVRTHYRPCYVPVCPAPCPPVVTTCAPPVAPCAPVVTTCEPVRYHYVHYGWHRGWHGRRCR